MMGIWEWVRTGTGAVLVKMRMIIRYLLSAHYGEKIPCDIALRQWHADIVQVILAQHMEHMQLDVRCIVYV